MNYFNQYVIGNNKMHPVQEAIYNACLECEKLPASEQQTATITAISKAMKIAEDHLELVEMIAFEKTKFNQ